MTDVAPLLHALRAWAGDRGDVRALALVGSHARGEPGADSDVDVVLLVDDPARFTGADEWIAELGGAEPIRTVRWGALTERRLRMPDGLELDVGVVAREWASVEPVDAGTAKVVRDGMVPVYDPDGLLAALAGAVSAV